MSEVKEKEKKKKGEHEADEYTFDSEMSEWISGAIAKKKKSNEEARRKKKRRAIILSVCAVCLVLGAVYAAGWAASMGRFLPNSYINGIDVSGMNVSEAAAALTGGTAPENITVNERGGGVKTFSPMDFGYSFDAFGEVKRIYKNVNHGGWIGAYFKDSFYETQSKPSYDEEKLRKLLSKTVWGTVETSDAQLIHGDRGYYIQDEVYGDRADPEKAKEYVLSQVAAGNFTVDLEQGGCYTEPTVFASDLEGKLEDLNTKFNYVITYDFDYTAEVLTGAQVYEWMGNGGVLDRSKVESYVNNLAAKYDTFMSTRSFNTTKRGRITLSQGRYSTGQYGWWIDKEKTVEKLIEYINNGQSVDTEPEYVTLDTGYVYRGYEPGRSESGDIGSTYIEVDLSAQHMWYYENGKVKFETDQIVSGKASDPKRKTPEGVYSVYTKATNYTMKAADGSYTAKCSYFMRCSFEGIGFHDLSRSAYGGNIYLTNGSHGCINMKYDEVKQLYDIVERGTPVIMYY